MKKPTAKRLPQGVTQALLMDALLLLSTKNGQKLAPVSRAELAAALPRLPITTMDERLKYLVDAKRVIRVGRGMYKPFVPMQNAVAPRHPIPANPPGTVMFTHDEAGQRVRVEWVSLPEPQPAPPARNPARAAIPPAVPEKFDFEQARRRPAPHMK